MEPFKNDFKPSDAALPVPRTTLAPSSLQLAAIQIDPENALSTVRTVACADCKALPSPADAALAPGLTDAPAQNGAPPFRSRRIALEKLFEQPSAPRQNVPSGAKPATAHSLQATAVIHKPHSMSLRSRLRHLSFCSELDLHVPDVQEPATTTCQASVFSPKTMRVLGSVMPQGERELSHSLEKGKHFVIHEKIDKILARSPSRTDCTELLIARAKLHIDASELTQACQCTLEALLTLSAHVPDEQARYHESLLPLLYDKLRHLPPLWLQDPRRIIALHASEPYHPDWLHDPEWVDCVLAHTFFCVWHETVFSHAFERHFSKNSPIAPCDKDAYAWVQALGPHRMEHFWVHLVKGPCGAERHTLYTQWLEMVQSYQAGARPSRAPR